MKGRTKILKQPLWAAGKRGYWATLARDILHDKYLYFMLAPCLVYFIIFHYLPMYGLQIAFKDYNIFTGIEKSVWVGFEHFIHFFKSPNFFRTLKNTLLISLYSLAVGFTTPIILALLLNEVRSRKFRGAVQTVVYIPHFISTVVVAGLVTNFLSPSYGIINTFIEMLGGEKIYFMVEPKYFRTIYVLMNVWKEAGFSTIVYLAALTAVDTQLYEAAVLDGAGRWKQTLHVTIPCILPTIVTMLIMRVGNILQVGYEAIILLYQPSTYEVADTISTFVYRSGMVETQYSFAAAVDLFNGVIALILVSGANLLSRKLTETSLW